MEGPGTVQGKDETWGADGGSLPPPDNPVPLKADPGLTAQFLSHWGEGDVPVQREAQAGSEGFSIDAPALTRYVTSGSGGQPLEPQVQRKMEQGFGRSLDGVRVHQDGQADAASSALGARAFTHGKDIYFAAGQYNPSSAEGIRLLAHELTHTFQQGDQADLQTKLQVGGHNDAAEVEADRVADEVVRRSEIPAEHRMPDHRMPATGRGVQRKEALDSLHRTAVQLKGLELGEGPVPIEQRSALTTVRRMGRAPSERERDLERMQLHPEQMTQEIFNFFYPGLPQPDPGNPRAQQLAARMLWEAIQGSRRMDLIPRPPSGPPGPSWLAMQAVQIAWRRGRDEGIYHAVKVVVARNFRTEFEMIVNGL